MIANDCYICGIFCVSTWNNRLAVHYHLLYSDIRYKPLTEKLKIRNKR